MLPPKFYVEVQVIKTFSHHQYRFVAKDFFADLFIQENFTNSWSVTLAVLSSHE